MTISVLLVWSLGGCFSGADQARSVPGVEVPGEQIPERKAGADRVSASGRLIHEAGGTRFEVRFGRPAARGREIFGGVVPYGQVWRTGADEATVVAFEDDVRINGGPLPRGVYALFTIPYAHEWVVIFNERAEQWGASAYDEDEDALRVAIAPRPLDPPVEVLDIVGTEQGFALRWADVEIPVRVQRDTSSPTARPAFGEP